eukprot:5119787-Alexandrium_andersonii.AAC.1
MWAKARLRRTQGWAAALRPLGIYGAGRDQGWATRFAPGQSHWGPRRSRASRSSVPRWIRTRRAYMWPP